VLLPGRQPVPVAMSNDRDGETLIPSALLQPGESHSARVTLGNDGILPFGYSVSSEGSGSGALRLTIQNATDGRPLYRGVLDGAEKGRLMTGQHQGAVWRHARKAVGGGPLIVLLIAGLSVASVQETSALLSGNARNLQNGVSSSALYSPSGLTATNQGSSVQLS